MRIFVGRAFVSRISRHLICLLCEIGVLVCLIVFLYSINYILGTSYPSCSGARAPGLAADMRFRDDVIAFIGPACAFALEPVARLAAYWNTPIITGMGDQVNTTFECSPIYV